MKQFFKNWKEKKENKYLDGCCVETSSSSLYTWLYNTVHKLCKCTSTAEVGAVAAGVVKEAQLCPQL